MILGKPSEFKSFTVLTADHKGPELPGLKTLLTFFDVYCENLFDLALQCS
jgi:hypothetical protein